MINYFKKKKKAKTEDRKKEEFRLRMKYGSKYNAYVAGKALAEAILGR